MNEILNAEGTYTVLAPSDVAFYQMPEEALSEISKDARKAAALLKQHILPGTSTINDCIFNHLII